MTFREKSVFTYLGRERKKNIPDDLSPGQADGGEANNIKLERIWSKGRKEERENCPDEKKEENEVL